MARIRARALCMVVVLLLPISEVGVLRTAAPETRRLLSQIFLPRQDIQLYSTWVDGKECRRWVHGRRMDVWMRGYADMRTA